MTDNDLRLYYGDNLPVMQKYLADESVDLIYLDPPFNSQRNYNVSMRDREGHESESQIVAFTDTWFWTRQTQETYENLLLNASNVRLSKVIEALYIIHGSGEMMAYLVMMAPRLIEMHRILKPTGSFYLHCDVNAASYLKLLLDAVFGKENFRTEFIWKRTSAHSNAKRKVAIVSDSIFFYTKTSQYTFNEQYTSYEDDYIKQHYRYVDENGRRYTLSDLRNPSKRPNLTYEYKGYQPHKNGWAVSLEKMQQYDAEGRLHFPAAKSGRIRLKNYLDQMPGVKLTNLWTDIAPIGAQAKERTGYPTQKPLALLERIIRMSSNPGDMVFDPFAGCGTAMVAAQKLGRRWIGIDIAYLGINMLSFRLGDNFNLHSGVDYKVIGQPKSVDDARALATDKNNDGRYQFEFWALSLVAARTERGTEDSYKKKADKGVDGFLTFLEVQKSRRTTQAVLVQVKSGKVGSADLRNLRGAVEREKAALGIFITLEEPTRDMAQEAITAGTYYSPTWNKTYPKLQILTIQQLLEGCKVDMPPQQPPFESMGGRIMTDVPQQPPLI